MTNEELNGVVVTKLMERWLIDPVFIECSTIVLNNTLPGKYANYREWYERFAPQMMHYYSPCNAKDLRGLKVSGLTLLKEGFFTDACLSHADFSSSHLIGSRFQNAILHFANFTGAHLEWVQMSPIYAHMADFTDAVIEGGFFQSAGPMVLPHCSLFTMTKMVRVKANKAAFDRCDFKGSDMRGAVFSDCDFRKADFRYISTDADTRFINCDFENSIFQDHEPVRVYLENETAFQNCTGMDSIQWIFC